MTNSEMIKHVASKLGYEVTEALGFDTQQGVFDHDFRCVSPGEYDFVYECAHCGLRYTESIDNPNSQRPTTPCPGAA